MTLEERIERATTKTFKAVLPNTTNHYNTLFGGTALQMMDEVAFITATRFAKKKMVTASTNKIRFLKPINPGVIVEIIGKVVKVGLVKVEVLIEIYTEEMYVNKKELAITGVFTLAAVNNENKPIALG